MTYQPRGKVKQLIDAMREQPEHGIWTSTEVAAQMDVSQGALTLHLNAAIKHGVLLRELVDGKCQYSLGAQPEAAPEPEPDDAEVEFRFALWNDGELVIYGAQENTDGSVTLSRDQVAEIKQMIAWAHV